MEGQVNILRLSVHSGKMQELTWGLPLIVTKVRFGAVDTPNANRRGTDVAEVFKTENMSMDVWNCSKASPSIFYRVSRPGLGLLVLIFLRLLASITPRIPPRITCWLMLWNGYPWHIQIKTKSSGQQIRNIVRWNHNKAEAEVPFGDCPTEMIRFVCVAARESRL